MLGRTLILYLVIETNQEHCIVLESCSGHGRNSLLWVENGSEGLVVYNKREPPPIEVHMEPFHPSYDGKCLLVNLGVLAFCLGQ